MTTDQSPERDPRETTFGVTGHHVPRAIPMVEYVSNGALLISGERSAALGAARQLPSLSCTIIEQGSGPVSVSYEQGCHVITGGSPLVDGWLGQFNVAVEHQGQRLSLRELLGNGPEAIDLILDLGKQPLFTSELPPPGYYRAEDADTLEDALSELQQMRGTFEKPRFFSLNTDICAHGRSGQRGCTRCLDACPAEAISSDGDYVTVNPFLCQGGGSCATACPTGAISYTLPDTRSLLQQIRRRLTTYREAGGTQPCLLIHDPDSAETSQHLVQQAADGHILPLALDDIGCVGLDTCLASYCYGANRIILLYGPQTPPKVVRELETQTGTASAILTGLGYPPDALLTLNAATVSPAEVPSVSGLDGGPAVFATFAAMGGKRDILKLAINHLCEQATVNAPHLPLPEAAPFGEILVERDACTLCMGCVSICPSQALTSGDTTPALHFTEWNCVQCGLCASACPEQAIQLNPRLATDAAIRSSRRTLKQDQAISCTACGTPLATHAMLEKIEQKLAGHAMFQTEEARRRLRMCPDCRVRDMNRDQAER